MPSISLLHFLRISQITSGIAGRAAVALGLITILGFVKCARGSGATQQECRASGAALQLDRTQVHERAGFDTYGLFTLGDARITTSHFVMCPFSALYCGAPYGQACGSSGSRYKHLHQPPQSHLPLMHCAAGADFCTCGVIAMVQEMER